MLNDLARAKRRCTGKKRLIDPHSLGHLNLHSSLVVAALSVMLVATAPGEFGVPECIDTLEAAGLNAHTDGGLILPNSSRVSLLTYKAIVAVRYPELVLHAYRSLQVGHFVSHDQTVEHGGFRAVLWDAPQDLRNAVEEIVVLLEYLRHRHRDVRQGATSQLLVGRGMGSPILCQQQGEVDP